MSLVCPLTCRFNLPGSRLTLYVLAYLMDCDEEGWVRRTVLYDHFGSWVKEQEKGLLSDYRLPYTSGDTFYAQLDQLGLQQRKQRWVYYFIPTLEASGFQLSYHKGDVSPVAHFTLSGRSPDTATRAMTEGATVTDTTTGDLAEAAAALEQMAQQPKRIPPEVLVQQAYDTLLAVLKNGYTYTEIAKIYGRHGIKVTPSQLRLQVEAAQAQRETAETTGMDHLRGPAAPCTTGTSPQGLLRTKLADCREALCLTTAPLPKAVR